MSTTLYRAIVYVTDIEGIFKDSGEVADEIENARYPEHKRVAEVDWADIGEWSDEHPANFTDADLSQYFPEKNLKLNKDMESNYAKLTDEYVRIRSELIELKRANKDLRAVNEGLEEEIEKLKKVQEFVKTIKELTK